jgi:hypothetical protein
VALGYQYAKKNNSFWHFLLDKIGKGVIFKFGRGGGIFTLFRVRMVPENRHPQESTAKKLLFLYFLY